MEVRDRQRDLARKSVEFGMVMTPCDNHARYAPSYRPQDSHLGGALFVALDDRARERYLRVEPSEF
jgi:hypothetical protein